MNNLKPCPCCMKELRGRNNLGGVSTDTRAEYEKARDVR